MNSSVGANICKNNEMSVLVVVICETFNIDALACTTLFHDNCPSPGYPVIDVVFAL